MIKVCHLETAARVAASRRRGLEALALFKRRKEGQELQVWVDGGHHTVKGDVADQVANLVADDLQEWIAEASDALARAGVDLTDDKPGAPDQEDAGTTIETHTIRGNPRCVALKPCGNQCFNGTYQVGGLCGVHIRMPIHRQHLGDSEQASLPSP
jgi:hypothetical protein